MNIEKIVRSIIAEVAEKNIDDYPLDANLEEDLGLDSLSLFEIEDKLEERFKINLDGKELQTMKTLQSVIERIGEMVCQDE